MKQAIGLALLALALTGCQTMKDHPKATLVVWGIVTTSIIVSANGGRHSHVEEPRMSTPLVDCSKVPGSCQ